MTFIGQKIWNKVASNIKTVATTDSLRHSPKKEILVIIKIFIFDDSRLFFLLLYLFAFIALGEP